MFDPALLPTNEASLSEYGNTRAQDFVRFYGSEVTIEFEGNTYSSLPLIDGDEISTERRLFKRVLAKETKALTEKKKLTKPPILQGVKKEMESTNAYADIFPEIFKLFLNHNRGTRTDINRF